MNITLHEVIFQNRKRIGENILNLIKDTGYTKASFSRLTDISRPTLDKVISGEIDSATTLTTHLDKILKSQGISIDNLINYVPKYELNKMPALVFSNNAPENHVLKPQAKEMFAILDDIAHLCELYYK
jgi:predicted transcriptional regulator